MSNSNSENATSSNEDEYNYPDRLDYRSPDELKWDEEGHVRSAPADPSEPLIRNINELGRLVEPIHARSVDGELLVFDGWRRVQACAEAGIDVATLVYDDLALTDALAKSLNLHTGVWQKTVSDNDREQSLMGVATGEVREPRGFFSDDESKINDARYRLGLDGEEDKLRRKIGGLDGIGPSTVAGLIAEFGDTQNVLDASETELQNAAGVGPSTASTIREHLDYDGPQVVSHDVE